MGGNQQGICSFQTKLCREKEVVNCRAGFTATAHDEISVRDGVMLFIAFNGYNCSALNLVRQFLSFFPIITVGIVICAIVIIREVRRQEHLQLRVICRRFQFSVKNFINFNFYSIETITSEANRQFESILRAAWRKSAVQRPELTSRSSKKRKPFSFSDSINRLG